MNHYTWQELSIGMEEHFTVIVTSTMMDQFKDITGDENPLHSSESFAVGKGYSGKVVYGMLTASFLSTLAGVYLPGEQSLIYSVESKFLKPVFPGDELTVSGVVEKMDERFHTIWLKTLICNQKGERVLRGSMQIGVK